MVTMTHDDPRTRILDAAEHAFAESGLAGARVAAIAREAGVNKAMLYYYFGSKASLYQAVFERVLDQVADIAHTALDPAADDPLVQVGAFMDGYAQVLQAHPRFVPIMVREVLSGGEQVLPTLRSRIGALLPTVAGSLQQAQRSGQINPDVVFPIAGPVLISPLVFFAIAQPVLSMLFGPVTPALAEAYHQSAKEIVINGLRARDPREES